MIDPTTYVMTSSFVDNAFIGLEKQAAKEEVVEANTEKKETEKGGENEKNNKFVHI